MLSIRTLGHLNIAIDGCPLHFETRTVAALLVYLAHQRQSVSRDALAEFLWPERTQRQARSNLRVALHRLRQHAGDYLLTAHSSAAIHPNAALTLDAAHFEQHLAAGRLAEATALYNGDFLADFYLDGSPAFEQWALLERERLRALALAAWQQSIDQHTAGGEWSAATSAARRLLQMDPLHEPTHRQLMRLLAQTGQRSAALAQYESCRHLLATELAVPPDEATTVLAEQIREGVTEWPGDSATLSPPLPVTSSPLHNLPAQPTPFIGRAADLGQISQLLANPDCRLLTLLGVGGIGKTRLAVESARRILDSAPVSNPQSPIPAPLFPDGLCFVALSPVETAGFVAATLAQSLGLTTNSADPVAEIADYLRPRRLLLILDNFEHLLPAADTVAYLLQRAPHLKVLVTSRQRLHLREEWLLPVNGMALTGDGVDGVDGLDGVGRNPVNGAMAVVGAGEAGALFLRSAQRVQPGFQAQGQEAAITSVCRLVEGMPLALELAASWVRLLPCAEIARQIQRDSDFLTAPLRNLPERHRSLRALFDHSWRLLSAEEQRVLAALSVFRGGWQLEEAAGVADATLALLLGLVDKSLVRVTGQARFDLHELVRQYAAEQLMARSEDETIRRRHYDAYLRLFRTGDSHLRGPHAATWVARLEAELDNLRAAFQWAFDTAHYADAAWLMLAVCWFWEHRGFYEEAHHWFAQLLPQRGLLPTDLRLAVMVWYNPFDLKLRASQPIEKFWDELMALQESTSLAALRTGSWVFYATQVADPAVAAQALERAVAFGRAANAAPAIAPEYCFYADSDSVLGKTLQRYAGSLIDLGDVASAAKIARESYDFFQSRGNRFERFGGLALLGRLALLAGDIGEARRCLQEAVQIVTEAQELQAICDMQSQLGLVILYAGDVAEAGRLLNECRQLCLKLKSHLVAARVCAYLAEVELSEGEPDQAAQWLAQSLAYNAQMSRDTFDEVQRRWLAARLATAQQQYRRAATLFGLAEQAHQQVRYVIGGPMRALADAALATVQAALEPAVFAESFAAGQQMALAEANRLGAAIANPPTAIRS